MNEESLEVWVVVVFPAGVAAGDGSVGASDTRQPQVITRVQVDHYGRRPLVPAGVVPVPEYVTYLVCKAVSN